MKKINLQKAQTVVGGALACEVTYSSEVVNDKTVCYQTTTCEDKYGRPDRQTSITLQVAAYRCEEL